MIELTIDHEHSHPQQELQPHKEEPQDDEEDEEQEKQEHHGHLPCHPHRPVHNFDFSAIEEQIKMIRRRKQEAKEAARRAQKIAKNKKQIYETDIIQQALEQSMELVSENLSMALKQRIKFIEDKVFISAQNQNFGELVSRIKKEVLNNQALSNELNLVMSSVQADIQNDIQEGEYTIQSVPRKQKFVAIEPQPAHRVKLKNMLLRSKIVDLREEFNQSQIGSQSLITASIDSGKPQRKDGEVWGDQFHLLSKGTQQAQEFIKKIRKQQKQYKSSKQKRQIQLKSLEVKSAMESKQFQQQMKKERHQSLKKRYMQGRQIKKNEKAKQMEVQKQFNAFAKEYRGRKPLYKAKEEAYLKQVIEEQNRKRKMQLEEIHHNRKPITREEFQQHQQQYQKARQQKLSQLQQEKEVRKKVVASLPQKSYFRGRYHSVIHQEKQEIKNAVDPNIARDELHKKQKEFGQFVRKKYAPHVNETKKTQLQQLMQNLAHQGGRKGLTEEQCKKVGNQYLKQMHKMIEELRKKGLLKPNAVVEEQPVKKDYLKQIRDRYNFSTVDFSSQAQKNPQWVQNAAFKLQSEAKHKEKVMRHKKNSLDLDKYMKNMHEINDDYIKSAQAKMSLINHLEGRGDKRVSSSRYSIDS